uniref:Uncharacterized protein n=1 Tax=Lactuca sativa TaxID=4236 RepID=A0A9R1V5Z9_LACSA|nr:hypothetical protein LSAT_V11C600331140 [Lactuca sativa]
MKKAYNGEKIGELHTYVHRVHWLETWKAAYIHKVEPIKGIAMWPISECPIKITPPLHHNQLGGPRKREGNLRGKEARRKERTVMVLGGVKLMGLVGVKLMLLLKRKFIGVTCSKCKNKGGNARTCKGQLMYFDVEDTLMSFLVLDSM